MTLLLILCSISFTFFLKNRIKDNKVEDSLVLLNEIVKLTEEGNSAEGQILVLRQQILGNGAESKKIFVSQISLAYGGFMFLYALFVLLYIYGKVLKPFHKLEHYANEVAKGNLDITLKYERTNFFGAFTWAFDHMREEIFRARKNEEQAVAENKTVIAALSHDIKTPIASIRAYAEGLEAGLDADYESRERYLKVIMKKCDEVTALTNDLVLHSLSELEKLEIRCHNIMIGKVLEEIFRDLEYCNMDMHRPFAQAQVWADEKRLAQAIENLLNNASKYAPEALVEVWTLLQEDRYEIHIRDYGSGVLPEDMPFLCEKFYRGKNAGEKSGSGLGLYIVQYIMKRMEGGLCLTNHTDGLEVVVWLGIIAK